MHHLFFLFSFILLLNSTSTSFGADSLKFQVRNADNRFIHSAGRWSFNLGLGIFRHNDRTESFPRFEFETLLGPSVSASVYGEFVAKKIFGRGETDPTSFAFGMGLHYYSKRFFRGFVAEINAREKLTKEVNERYAKSFSLVPMVGWRWINTEHHASFITKVGLEKTFVSNSTLVPTVAFALGVDFNPEEVFY